MQSSRISVSVADGLLRSTVQVIGSDMLGNHRIGVSVDEPVQLSCPRFYRTVWVLDTSDRYWRERFTTITNTTFWVVSREGAAFCNELLASVRMSITHLTDTIALTLNSQCTRSRFPFNYQTSEPLDPYHDRGLLTIGSVAFVGDTTMLA